MYTTLSKAQRDDGMITICLLYICCNVLKLLLTNSPERPLLGGDGAIQGEGGQIPQGGMILPGGDAKPSRHYGGSM